MPAEGSGLRIVTVAAGVTVKDGICVGNSLARLEASAAFSRLLVRFPNLSAVPGSPPTRRDRLVLRGYQTLPAQMAAKAVR